MHGINEIRKQNVRSNAESIAQLNTHYSILPDKKVSITVQGHDGKNKRGIIDSDLGKQFLQKIENHVGPEKKILFLQTLCREFLRRQSALAAA